MKKIYTKPEIAVVDIKPTQLLSGSPEIPVYTDPEKLIKKPKKPTKRFPSATRTAGTINGSLTKRKLRW